MRSFGPFALAIALLPGAACGPAHENGVAGTVDLGDDFVAPDLQLDDAFFYCRIQPEVLTRHSCASGEAGEESSCHSAASALRLRATEDPPPCDGDGELIDSPSEAYEANLEAIRFSVQSDPLTSPLYLRPLNRASHPRMIFDSDDPAAELIVEWISGASP
jgi:hypothetical protein